MGLFDSLSGAGLSRAAGSFSTGASIGSAIAGLAAPGLAKKAEAGQAKTRKMVADINAKRTARELRYAQGLASVQVAAGGGAASYGSNLFAMADDARKKAEIVEQEYLTLKLQDNAGRRALPTFGGAALDLAGTVAGVYGNSLKRSAYLET